MRVNPDIIYFIKQQADNLFPGTEVYLFGSRISDTQKGGDIDLLFLSKEPIEKNIFRV